jgi:NAD(P)-dependent dehydrogenase (short-subunit alcohol dehydrogenase family)
MGLEKFSLNGRVAIVTGAASKQGIGRGIALALAGAGADVVVCDYKIKEKDLDLEETAELVRQSGRRCLTVKADISQRSEVINLVQTVVKEFGTIDIMVNNAAAFVLLSFLEDKGEYWDRIMDVNLKGCYMCCQEVARVMVKNKGGCIVNIASGTGLRWIPDSVIYGMSKAGIMQLTRWLGYELGKYNIRVNAIAPGLIDTNNVSRRLDLDKAGPQGKTEEQPLDILERIPLGRLGQPGDIVDVVLFLASDASRYVTGQTIIADGGLLLSGV